MRGDGVVIDTTRDGRLDELRLSAVTVCSDDHLPSYAIRDLGAVVAPDEVEAQVDSRSRARGGEDVAAIHVEHVGVDSNPRKPCLQQAGELPVGGRLLAVEQAGSGEREGARTDRDQACAICVRPAQRADELPRRLGAHVRTAGKDHRVGSGEGLQTRRRDELEAAHHGDWSRPLGADSKGVPPRNLELRPPRPKNLGGDPEVERGQSLEGQHSDAVRGAADLAPCKRHVWIVAGVVL